MSNSESEMDETVVLFRPTGPHELALIEESGYSAFPPCLTAIILLPLSVSVFAISLINGLTVAKLFLAVIFPLLPTFIWAYREIKGQTEAASEKDELRKYAEELWENAMHKRLPMEEVDK